jgi:hypothetical protein
VEPISTITEFLQTGGARLRFFDMGRRVDQLPRDRFLQFEKTEIPYPYPLQQQAWFALLLQDKRTMKIGNWTPRCRTTPTASSQRKSAWRCSMPGSPVC